MSNQVQIFTNEEFGRLEVLTIEGNPYFPAKECAEILGHKNPHKAVIDHCREDGLTKCEVIDSLGRKQKKNYISEGNLYRLIIRSKLPAAERFESWVCDEVLPSIRRHGAYITSPTIARMREDSLFSESLLETLSAERAKYDELLDYVERLQPKVEYCDAILAADKTIPVSIIAKDYGMSAAAFNKLLHAFEVQYKIGGVWLLYAKYANQGYTASKTFHKPNGEVEIYTHWTQKGRNFLYYVLKYHGILPVTEVWGEEVA